MVVRLIPDTRRPVEIRLEGTCPHCSHALEFGHPLRVHEGIGARMEPVPDDRGAQRLRLRPMRREEDVQVLCECEIIHPGAPAGARGCGASWYRYVAWGEA